MLYRCLRLPKQKRKDASLFEQQSSSEFYYYVAQLYNNKLQMSCELLFFTTAAFIFTFCVVMPQRSETVVCVTCIVHATAMALRIFLLFRYSL